MRPTLHVHTIVIHAFGPDSVMYSSLEMEERHQSQAGNADEGGLESPRALPLTCLDSDLGTGDKEYTNEFVFTKMMAYK